MMHFSQDCPNLLTSSNIYFRFKNQLFKLQQIWSWPDWGYNVTLVNSKLLSRSFKPIDLNIYHWIYGSNTQMALHNIKWTSLIEFPIFLEEFASLLFMCCFGQYSIMYENWAFSSLNDYFYFLQGHTSTHFRDAKIGERGICNRMTKYD